MAPSWHCLLVNRWLPWLLVVALGGGVAFAVVSKNEPEPPLSALPTPAPESTGQPQDNEPEPANKPPPGADETLSGVVREHFDVAQYTYLHLATDAATDAGSTWAAVYRAPVKDGMAVQVIHASRLTKFHSRELNRDFDTIWFGMLPGYETAPQGNGNASGSAMAQEPAGSTSAAAAASGLPPPKGMMTIVALAAAAKFLDGKTVTVAGHVVKETDGVLDRNWVHLQDGTGNAKDGTNDVLVTTDPSAAPRAIGDEVVATGTLRTNQDFGSGYAYKFMLEKAALSARTR